MNVVLPWLDEILRVVTLGIAAFAALNGSNVLAKVGGALSIFIIVIIYIVFIVAIFYFWGSGETGNLLGLIIGAVTFVATRLKQ